jgi:stage II sporulation protein D
LNDEFLVVKALNFEQKQRKTFFIDPSLGIPLRDVRAAFNLRSTFFSCEPVGEKILLKGKGFGHGIGLCQEGAMEMVGQGKTYNEILKYYFKGSKLSTSDFPINHW